MTIEALKEKTLEIANLLFTSKERFISRIVYQNLIQGEFEEYSDLIREALLSNNKIKKNRGRTGGLQFVLERYQRSAINNSEKKNLDEAVEKLWKKYKQDQEKTPNQKPEKEIENSFKIWIESRNNDFHDAAIVNFRSNAKRGGKFTNVDGYLIQIEKCKYHIGFSPILTCFEVKAGIPNKVDVMQARSYTDFSHHVYLVFKSSLDKKTLAAELNRNGYSTQDNVGVYVTADGINFERLHSSKHTNPTREEVEKHLEILLSDDDKEKLLDEKYKYLLSEILIPAISPDMQ